MSVQPVTFYVATCDGCTASLGNEEYSAWSDEDGALTAVEDDSAVVERATTLADSLVVCDDCMREYAKTLAGVLGPESGDVRTVEDGERDAIHDGDKAALARLVLWTELRARERAEAKG